MSTNVGFLKMQCFGNLSIGTMWVLVGIFNMTCMLKNNCNSDCEEFPSVEMHQQIYKHGIIVVREINKNWNMYVDTAKIYIILNPWINWKYLAICLYLKFTYLFSKNKWYNRIAQLVSDHLFKIF